MKAAVTASGQRCHLCDSVVPAPWSQAGCRGKARGAEHPEGLGPPVWGQAHGQHVLVFCVVHPCRAWVVRLGWGGVAVSPAEGVGGVCTRHPSLMRDQAQMLSKPEVARPGEGAGRASLSLVPVGALVMKTIPLPLRLFGSLVTIFKIVRYP